LRAIGKSSQQPFAALYAATRGYITIDPLDRPHASFETAAVRPPQDEVFPHPVGKTPPPWSACEEIALEHTTANFPRFPVGLQPTD
jgi:hypothetical protein